MCCDIVKARICNHRAGTIGDTMRLRLMMAPDTGVRREEMMLIQLNDIDFRRRLSPSTNGDASCSQWKSGPKGERTTGEKEFVYVVHPRREPERPPKGRPGLRSDALDEVRLVCGGTLENRVADAVLSRRICDWPEKSDASTVAVHRVLPRGECLVAPGACLAPPVREADQLQARKR